MIIDLLLGVGAQKPQSWEGKLTTKNFKIGKGYLQTICSSTLYCKVKTTQGINQEVS